MEIDVTIALCTFFENCDVEGPNSSFFITETAVENANAKSKMAVTVTSYMTSSYLD